ncbi:uncharacterized protein LOC133779485 [Humulus lupulus]|uniref:uncharacterized protein LOC133779485 n=1 Tax=Humulus lupulus TaxID=3486 RepID=UPI002B407E09|nr:uncharacterized protein LOC133779485 [Humulus lupulus]
MLNNRPQGNLPSNTVVNPKENCQAILLRSGKQVEQPSVQKSVVQNEELGEKYDTNEKGVTEDHQSSEKCPPFVDDQPVRVPYPQRLRKTTLDKQFSKFLERKMEDYETVALTEECSAILQRKLPQKLRDPGNFTIPCTMGKFECKHALCDLGASINLMPLFVFRRLGLGEASPTTVTLQLEDRSIKHPRGIIEDVLVKVDKFIFPADFIVLDMEEDENIPIILGRPFLATGQALIDVQKEKAVAEINLTEDSLQKCLTTDDIDYELDRENETLLVTVSSSLSTEEMEKLLRFFRTHKLAIGWTLADIQGISPSTVMHKILMEDDSKPSIEAQRRLNPAMKEVVRKEILKWLYAGVIYPILDSSWVSPVQMLDRLAGHQYYYFLDGYSGYHQIAIALEDQEKTTFTCPYGTFAFRRMPFGLYNAPATFQRCMMAIFSDRVERSIENFMDDFSVMGSSFDDCLLNLEAVLRRCEEANLVLNWEKCHFMVNEGIVLGHKVSKNGIEVDRAKIATIENLPPPVSVKGVRSFLGHAGFYRRFIKDISKISKPLSALLMNGVPFEFDEKCLEAFRTLKQKLVSTLIVISPNWELPFELMCDASDFVVGAVLGQHVNKVFQTIYYASRTLNGA